MSFWLALTVQAEDLSELCRNLDGHDLETRERAADVLRTLGRPALKRLRALARCPDPELRWRAASLVETLQGEINAKAFRLDLVPERRFFAVGERVTLRVRLTNVDEEPHVVPRDASEGGVRPSPFLSLSLASRAVWPDLAHGSARWVLNVEERHFAVIRPGETVELGRLSFHEALVHEGKTSTRRVPLAPGRYRADLLFAFERSPRLLESLEFRGGARRLFEEAWTGELRAEAGFEIVSGAGPPWRP